MTTFHPTVDLESTCPLASQSDELCQSRNALMLLITPRLIPEIVLVNVIHKTFRSKLEQKSQTRPNIWVISIFYLIASRCASIISLGVVSSDRGSSAYPGLLQIQLNPLFQIFQILNCLKDPTCAISLKSLGSQNIKYDISVCHGCYEGH